jgi:hypothetical protein
MPRKPKTWAEKMDAPPPHIDITEKAFAGIPPGTRLLISSPKEIDAYLRRRTKPGKTLTIPQLRTALARARGAEAICPLTTAIFLRIVAEHAW